MAEIETDKKVLSFHRLPSNYFISTLFTFTGSFQAKKVPFYIIHVKQALFRILLFY